MSQVVPTAAKRRVFGLDMGDWSVLVGGFALFARSTDPAANDGLATVDAFAGDAGAAELTRGQLTVEAGDLRLRSLPQLPGDQVAHGLLGREAQHDEYDALDQKGLPVLAHRGAHLGLQIGDVLGKGHWNLPMPALPNERSGLTRHAVRGRCS